MGMLTINESNWHAGDARLLGNTLYFQPVQIWGRFIDSLLDGLLECDGRRRTTVATAIEAQVRHALFNFDELDVAAM